MEGFSARCADSVTGSLVDDRERLDPRQRLADLPGWATILSGTALGAAAMAGTDLPAVMTGATSHPRQWTMTAWLSDLVPHALYGIVTAATYEVIRPRRSPLEDLAAIARR